MLLKSAAAYPQAVEPHPKRPADAPVRSVEAIGSAEYLGIERQKRRDLARQHGGIELDRHGRCSWGSSRGGSTSGSSGRLLSSILIPRRSGGSKGNIRKSKISTAIRSPNGDARLRRKQHGALEESTSLKAPPAGWNGSKTAAAVSRGFSITTLTSS